LYISNDTNICYYFSAPGTYTVSLHAYNNHDVTLTNILKIDTVTKADFSFELCSNKFINNSLCSSSFFWDFGDGNISSAFTPTHQYADTGHYTVKLIAYNGIKSDTLSQIIYVSVAGYTNPSFTYTISYDTVFVHAAYTGTQTNYYWSFNDPNNSATNFAVGKDTLHIYKDSIAAYGINLTVINPCGPTFKIDTVYIDLLPDHLTFVSNLAIIPNPASGSTINVYYNSFNSANYLATVYNALGEIVFELYFSFQAGVNGFKILNDGLAPGPYILVLQSENTYARRKFIVLKP
jgi:PKD repeat protein